MTLPVVYRRSPFSPDARSYTAYPGQTVEQILRDMPDLPPEIWTHGIVRIGEWEISREHWARCRPRAGANLIMQVGIYPKDGGGGGGGDGSKNPLAVIATIALVVATTAITGGILGPGGALSVSSTLFAAGSTSAALAAAGVAIVGSLAINALTPTASPSAAAPADKKTSAQLGSASFGGNQIGQFEPIPFVAGTHRIAPPHLIAPWTESLNDDQYIYAVVGLNGAHAFADIRINNTPIDDFPDVQYEIRDVLNDDTDLTLVDKQVLEQQLGVEVAGHKVSDDATDELQDTEVSSNSYPQWISARTKLEPDEAWLTFIWSSLVYQETTGGTVPGGFPLRIRIRLAGDVDWINLPEFHVGRERLEPFRGMVKLVFAVAPTDLVRVDQNTTVPPWKWALYVTDADNDEGFTVDAYFQPASGKNADAVGSGTDGIATIYLDPDTFPKGIYDIQVQRGAGYKFSLFAGTTYLYNSLTPYFFTEVSGSSPPALREEQSKIPAKLSWQSLSNTWNEYPLREKGMAVIAVRAKNTSVQSLTALTSGYANIWDGADWSNFEVTKNPAAWWRYLALGGQSVRAPFVEAQLDDANLEDWYDYCGDERVDAARFDGFTYLARGAGLTGAADSKQLTLAAWIYVDSESSGERYIIEDDGANSNRVVIQSDGTLLVVLVNSSNTEILNVTADFEFPTDLWTLVLFSVDLSDVTKRNLLLDRSEVGVTWNTYTDDTIDLTRADWTIGADSNGVNALVGALARFWLEDGLYIDFSDEAEQGAFISSNLRPVDLGDNGELPTGTAPIIYLDGGGVEWESNLGSGGDFSVSPASPGLIDDVVIDSGGLRNRECNAFFDGRQSLSDVLGIVAATGRASNRMSDKMGVVIDNDRRDETPIALFSQRNSRNLVIRRAFPRVPDGLRIQFNNEENEFQPEEFFVYRNPQATPIEIESIRYVGITSKGAAIDRAQLDLRQMLLRPALYNVETDIENFYCTRGSLVVLAHDAIRRHLDSARVLSTSVLSSDGSITGMSFDSALRFDLIGDAAAASFGGSAEEQSPPLDTLTRDGGLTGAADSKQFTFSVWLRVESEGVAQIIASTGTLADSDGRTRIQLTAASILQVIGVNSSGATILNVSTSELPVGRLVHVMGSFDMSDPIKRHLYVDRISDLASVDIYTDDTIDFTAADWGVGGYPDASELYDGQIAELWLEDGFYIDLSDEDNQSLLISTNGRPANLGDNGENVTGTPPIVYLSDFNDWHVNLGTGGGFTLAGALAMGYLFYSEGGFPSGLVVQLKDGSTIVAQVDEEVESSTATFETPQIMPAYLSFEGEWASAMSYAVDDVVAHAGEGYSCNVAHTSGAPNEPGVGVDWIDVWEPLFRDVVVVAGPFASVNRRMIVLGIKAQRNFTASMTLLDEGEPVILVDPDGLQLGSASGAEFHAPY